MTIAFSPKADDILEFWFSELSPEDHFAKNAELDQKIRLRFHSTLECAARGELFQWRETARGRFAEIIVLDQFSRNIFRDDAASFKQDSLALILAQEAVRTGADREIPIEQRSFLYMPYMHSESLFVHDSAFSLFKTPGLETILEFELLHRRILERFGRYPHRNRILGRASTPEEVAFLKTENSSF